MSVFREVAVVSLVNYGGQLDCRYAKGAGQEDIKAALYELIRDAVIQDGDSIVIDVVEVEED